MNVIRSSTVAAAVVALSSGLILSATETANAEPAYDVCGEAQYVTSLFVDLFHDNPPADRVGASDRVRLFAGNAPAEIKADALIEANAETAVLEGVPADLILRTDPVFQAWGDVMDWHTGHCLPQ
ncbi:hypothetical protein ACFWF7_14830 [Nocardia sp. NPDC060256]|uniref:hypothetical protein n=1 Tax=unclassified Nocardia TaxID=2637762 RepID=UPI0036465E2B